MTGPNDSKDTIYKTLEGYAKAVESKSMKADALKKARILGTNAYPKIKNTHPIAWDILTSYYKSYSSFLLNIDANRQLFLATTTLNSGLFGTFHQNYKVLEIFYGYSSAMEEAFINLVYQMLLNQGDFLGETVNQMKNISTTASENYKKIVPKIKKITNFFQGNGDLVTSLMKATGNFCSVGSMGKCALQIEKLMPKKTDQQVQDLIDNLININLVNALNRSNTDIQVLANTTEYNQLLGQIYQSFYESME